MLTLQTGVALYHGAEASAETIKWVSIEEVVLRSLEWQLADVGM